MSRVQLMGRLPNGESDGLSAVASKFVEDPDTKRVVVAVIDTKKIETDRDDGESTAKVRILRVEVIDGAMDDADAIRRIMLRAYERRTGQEVLPLDMEEALDEVFAQFVDMETGEIKDEGGDDGQDSSPE